MMLGLSLFAFTLLHTGISLVGIGSGAAVAGALVKGDTRSRWTALFLWTTVLTSVTGFMFPFKGVTPAIVLGAISLLVLAVTIPALRALWRTGGWRRTYVTGALVAFYFNVFVLVVQAFLKIPPLHALAPKGNEPPFAIAQLLVLAGFTWMGVKAVKATRPEGTRVPRKAA